MSFKRLIALSLILVVSFLLSSCLELDPNDIVRIEFDSVPKTTYVVGEEMEHFTLLVVTVEGVDNYVVSSYDNFDDIGISGFNTDTAGTRTMYITYEGLEISVTYQVLVNLESGFFAEGSGDGSTDSPYLIATVEHLSNIRLALNSHYRLIADIDLSGIEWDPIGQVLTIRTGPDKTSVNILAGFSGSINGEILDEFGVATGGKYKIDGLTTTTYGTRSWDNETGFGLFLAIQGTEQEPAVIKNVDFTNVSIEVGPAATTIANVAEYATFENINIYGEINGRAVAGVVGIAHDSTFNNVRNYAALTSNSALDNATDYRFMGGLMYFFGGTVEVNNSGNYANLVHPYTIATISEYPTRTIAGQVAAQAINGGHLVVNNFVSNGVIYGSAGTGIAQFVGYFFTSSSESRAYPDVLLDDATNFAAVATSGLIGNYNGGTITIN